MKVLILNDGTPKAPAHKSPLCCILNKDDKDKPLEVLIYDSIGKSDWTGEGFDAKDFVNELKGVDENRELKVRVNSRGGIVDEGITIYNRLREWKGKTVAVVDGAAASIASVIIMGADEVHMPRNAEILIHEAHGFAIGDATDMREAAERMDSASNRIAGIYAQKTGRSVEEMREYMRKTSVFNGEKAKDLGLADVLTDTQSLYNFTPEEISKFRQPPATTKPKNEKSMNRAEIIALLRKSGVTVADDATDAKLLELLSQAVNRAPANPPAPGTPPAGPSAEVTALQNAVKLLTEQNEREKKTRISAEIDKLIANDQLPGAQRDKCIARAMADETILDEYRDLPSKPPGAAPLEASVALTAEDPKQIEKAVLKLWGGRISNDSESAQSEARERGRIRAQIIVKQFDRLLPLLNINTVSADLKRTVILQQMIRAFAIRVLPLGAFSTVFNGILLEGTDKVAVPYFPLHTAASTDYVAANGYDTFQDTNSDAKVVTVDKRKYQALRWTSVEFGRQPYLDPAMNAMLQAEQLGIDVVNDVLSIVLAVTYGLGKTSPAAAFDSDDVADLKGVADLANWPSAGRSLIVNSGYDINLLKDAAVKSALNFGDNSPIRDGRIQSIYGFSYTPDGRVPANGENLQGMIAFKSGLLCAMAPVVPTAEVSAQLTRYELIIHPETGAQFTYRLWGNPDIDQSREIIECAYGKIAGEAAAIKRIVSA